MRKAELKQGVMYYWDNETSEEIEDKNPEFLVLDDFPFMYEGWNDRERKVPKTDVIFSCEKGSVVPIKLSYQDNGKEVILVEGDFNDPLTKAKIKQFSKFRRVLCVLYKEEIFQLKMTMSGFAPLDDMNIDYRKNSVFISDRKKVPYGKDGSYMVPVWSSKPIKEEDKEAANMFLDRYKEERDNPTANIKKREDRF